MPPGLGERELRLLAELASGPGARVAFQGIRRRLDLHPQALQRSLARLVEAGLVESNAQGYALTSVGRGLPVPGPLDERPLPVTGIALMAIPESLDSERLVDELGRRWFNGLHWYGVADGATGPVLVWTLDGTTGLVRVRSRPGAAAVEIVATRQDRERATAAGAHIIAALADLLGAPDTPETQGAS